MNIYIDLSNLHPKTIELIEKTLGEFGFVPYPVPDIEPAVVMNWLVVSGQRYGRTFSPKFRGYCETVFSDNFDFTTFKIKLQELREMNTNFLDFLRGNMELGLTLSPTKNPDSKLLKVRLSVGGNTIYYKSQKLNHDFLNKSTII